MSWLPEHPSILSLLALLILKGKIHKTWTVITRKSRGHLCHSTGNKWKHIRAALGSSQTVWGCCTLCGRWRWSTSQGQLSFSVKNWWTGFLPASPSFLNLELKKTLSRWWTRLSHKPNNLSPFPKFSKLREHYPPQGDNHRNHFLSTYNAASSCTPYLSLVKEVNDHSVEVDLQLKLSLGPWQVWKVILLTGQCNGFPLSDQRAHRSKGEEVTTCYMLHQPEVKENLDHLDIQATRLTGCSTRQPFVKVNTGSKTYTQGLVDLFTNVFLSMQSTKRHER